MAKVEKPTEWSPSALDTILTCSKAYEFDKSGAAKIDTSNPRQDLGTAFHDSVDIYYKTFQNINKDSDRISVEFNTIFHEECAKYHLPKLEKRRDRCLEQFVDFEVTRLKNPENASKPVFTEVKFTTKQYRGKIDFYNNGLIIDWKTGKFDKFDRKMLIQGKIYEIVGDEIGYPVKNTIFFVIGDEKPKMLPLPYVATDELEKYVEKANEIIASGEFPYIDEKNKHLCGFCYFNLICTFQRKGKTLWSDFL